MSAARSTCLTAASGRSVTSEPTGACVLFPPSVAAPAPLPRHARLTPLALARLPPTDRRPPHGHLHGRHALQRVQLEGGRPFLRDVRAWAGGGRAAPEGQDRDGQRGVLLAQPRRRCVALIIVSPSLLLSWSRAKRAPELTASRGPNRPPDTAVGVLKNVGTDAKNVSTLRIDVFNVRRRLFLHLVGPRDGPGPGGPAERASEADLPNPCLPFVLARAV